MNQQTNIQTVNTEVNTQLLLEVFQKYGITSSYPIDYEEFVKDVINTTTSTQSFVFDVSSISYSL
jgi:uncharacterized protein (UPF0276 family)